MLDDIILEKLSAPVKEALDKTEGKQYTQAVAVLTSKSNVYCQLIENALSEDKADEKALLESLNENGDTKAEYLLCCWKNGGVDIPSYAFREMMIRLNVKNEDTEIFVNTFSGIRTKKLKTTMK